MAEDNIIVGTGFSAMLAHLWLKEAARVFGAGRETKPTYRYQGFGYNKILGVKAASYVKLRNQLKGCRLHDRLVHGGNGTIWGGFVNIEGLSSEQLELLEAVGVVCKTLSFDGTGSISTGSEIRQFQFANGETLNPAKIIKDICDGFLERFEVLPDGMLRLHWSGRSGNLTGKGTSTDCRQLILAVGVVQLIDLLYRSSFLKEGDVVELSEFKYELRIVKKDSSFSEGAHTIRIGILRGLFHHLGIQHYPRAFALLDRCIPLAFDQVFYYDKLTQSFRIEKGALSDASFEKQAPFGKSIHYCNLKVNGVCINQFLQKISAQVVGLGMAFVDQATPGPISNDIFNDVVRKIWNEK